MKENGFESLKKSLAIASGKVPGESSSLTVEEDKAKTVTKTLKCGIYTEAVNAKNTNFTKLLTPEQLQELDYYIDTFEEKRREILRDYYHYYDKGVYDFLIHCARKKETRETVYEPIKEIPEQVTNIKKHDGSYVKVKAYKTKNVNRDNYNKTIAWVAIDKNTEDGCYKVLANYEDKKLNAENYKNYLKSNTLERDKFLLNINSQTINGRLSFFYLTGANYFDKYKNENGIEIKSILDNSKIHSPQFKEALGMKIAANIDAFAEKLMERIADVEKAFANKDQVLGELLNHNDDFPAYLREKITKKQKLFLKDFKEFSQESGDIKENAKQFDILAKELNVFVNNIIQAYLSEQINNNDFDYDDAYKRLRKKYLLKTFKDIPAFPLHEEDLQKGKKVTTKDVIDFAKEKLQQVSLASFKNYSFDVTDFATITAMEEDDSLGAKARWMQAAERAETSLVFFMYHSFMRRKNTVKNKIYHYFYYLVTEKNLKDQEAIIKKLARYSIDTMQKLVSHVEQEHFQHDGQAKRVFADSARMVVFYIAQALKDSGKKEQARKLELKIDDMLGNYKGNVFDNLKKKETSILAFSGFNVDEQGTKKGVAIVFENRPALLKPGNKRINKSRKRKKGIITNWYLAINLYEQIKFSGGNTIKDKITDYEPGTFFALSVKGGNEKATVQVKKLHEETFMDNSTVILIPLLVGKRQVREYFSNFDYYTLDDARTFFNSIEIVRETEKNTNRYYMCLATTRNIPEKKVLPEDKCYGYIGIDRGEKTVAWAALVDKDGNPLLPKKEANFFELGGSFKEKYDKKYKEIAGSQSRGSVKKLNIKGEVGKLIESIGADILSLSLKHGAKIVIENLGTTFGRRGKGVYVAVAQQYANLERFIKAKLQQNRIWESGKDGIIQTVPASYTSKMCSNCGTINSMRGKEELITTIEQLYTETETLAYTIPYKEWNININQNLTTWSKKERKAIEINVHARLVEILQDKRTRKKTDAISRLITKLLFPRKNDSEHYTCNFCGHTCNADKQAALNIARFHLIPSRTEAEKKKGMTTVEKLETVYQENLKQKIFKPGSKIL